MTTLEKEREKQNYTELSTSERAIVKAALELLRALANTRYETAKAMETAKAIMEE